jgi:3-deoxy-7-phosphoheptulonate synthase
MNKNINISEIKQIISPDDLLLKYAPSEKDINFISSSRDKISNILNGSDKRLLVIVGPCSIHDYDLAIEYAKKLKTEIDSNQNLYIVMRVYFEKPRSRVGWKGFIYDPDLDDSFNINKGLELARKLLLELTQMQIPIGCEFLDTITPQYLSDLVSWGAIGARTSESQIHRQLASGLSMPIGFKNLTSGDYEKAIDGIMSAMYPHNFIGIDECGKVSHIITKGNMDSHLILRGGDEPNYNEEDLEKISKKLESEKIKTGFIVDCSHGNSQKEYNRQILVALYLKRLTYLGKYPIRGIMLESNINKGNQKILKNINDMKKGVSVTDACINFDTTVQLLSMMNQMKVCEANTIGEIRKLIREYDQIIHSLLQEDNLVKQNEFINSIVLTKYMMHEDKITSEMCKGKKEEEDLIMMTGLRFALSERVAEIKVKNNPFDYLNIYNDYLRLITKRDVEKENLKLFQDPFYLKIMEVSKNIQVRYLEKFVSDIKIGYLFGKGTFSHEVITENIRGQHIAFKNYGELKNALENKSIDFMIIPTYNSIIGEIFELESYWQVHGSIDHKVELCLYGNVKDIKDSGKKIDVLYVEPHIEKECKNYIEKKLKDKVMMIETVKSSVEGCLKCIKDNDNEVGLVSLTISSKNNNSNFLYMIDDKIVEHNITTFSLVSL